MKRFFLGIVAAAAVALLSAPGMAQDGPYRLITGKTLGTNNTPALDAGRTTTLDLVNFGFMADKVRLCLDPRSSPVYIRFGTASTNNSDILATQATQDRMTVPSSSSLGFIESAGATSILPERAIPFYSMASSDQPQSINNVGSRQSPLCYEGNWNTRGIVMHTPTGLATMDVWGFQSARPR